MISTSSLAVIGCTDTFRTKQRCLSHSSHKQRRWSARISKVNSNNSKISLRCVHIGCCVDKPPVSLTQTHKWLGRTRKRWSQRLVLNFCDESFPRQVHCLLSLWVMLWLVWMLSYDPAIWGAPAAVRETLCSATVAVTQPLTALSEMFLISPNDLAVAGDCWFSHWRQWFAWNQPKAAVVSEHTVYL